MNGELMQAVNGALYQCIGNPDEMFIKVCQEKGGVLRGAKSKGDVVAEIDRSCALDFQGNLYESTVRRRDCSILCAPSIRNCRCKSCQAFRSTLRSMITHESHRSHSQTSANSHTRYCDLTPAEKDKRTKSLHMALRVSDQKVKQMQAKVEKLIASRATHLQSEDADDVSSVIGEVSPIVQTTFPEIQRNEYFGNSSSNTTVSKTSGRCAGTPLLYVSHSTFGTCQVQHIMVYNRQV